MQRVQKIEKEQRRVPKRLRILARNEIVGHDDEFRSVYKKVANTEMVQPRAAGSET